MFRTLHAREMEPEIDGSVISQFEGDSIDRGAGDVVAEGFEFWKARGVN